MSDPTKQERQLDTVVPVPTHFQITDLEGIPHTVLLQTFSVFKTKEVLKMLSAIKDRVDVIELISEIITLSQGAADDEGQVKRITAALNAIPKLMDFAPDLLLDFAALAMIPNKDLANAYAHNELDGLRAEKKTFLEFNFNAAVPIQVLGAYVPFLGIDFLVRELGQLNHSITNIAPASTTPTPSTG